VTRRVLSLSALVSLILLAYFLVPVENHLHPGNLVRAAVALLSLGLLAAGMIQLLRVHAQDNERRVEGLILGIVVVVVFFALGYYLLARHDPHQVEGLHTRIDALYFAMSTMSTIGFGDVHAAGQAARVLVIAQIVFDLVFVAAAASLVTAHLRQARTTQRKPR
jgi:voltage-gated potassium channel